MTKNKIIIPDEDVYKLSKTTVHDKAKTEYVVQRSETEDFILIKIWIKKDAMKVSVNKLMDLIGKVIPEFIKEKK